MLALRHVNFVCDSSALRLASRIRRFSQTQGAQCSPSGRSHPEPLSLGTRSASAGRLMPSPRQRDDDPYLARAATAPRGATKTAQSWLAAAAQLRDKLWEKLQKALQRIAVSEVKTYKGMLRKDVPQWQRSLIQKRLDAAEAKVGKKD